MKSPIKVLLIDDDLADRELARFALSKAEIGTFKTVFSTCLTEAEPLLRSDAFDVLLLDLGLPESFGKDTLIKVRAINQAIPIVVLTDLSDEQAAMECLNEGAQDYLFKSDLALESLSRAVRYAIQRQQLHQELSTANDMLEQRNEEMARMCDTAQRFVDNVSHEFRTPLTVITEYVSLLQDGVVGEVELDAEQNRFLDILADRANDLNTMVDDMLDVSKLQAGLLSTWRKNCELSAILRHLTPALETKAAIKDVKLEFAIEDNLPAIYCDGEKLGRVLINLVVNAIKFCGAPGHVKVSARANPLGREVVVSVFDNGPGISREQQDQIFGRFRQLESQVHLTQKGFGLGLNIAKELVDLNLGEMSLDSEIGKGSEFSFTVPYAEPLEVTRRFARTLRARNETGTNLAILEVEIPTESDSFLCDDVDAFLNFVLRPEDILFRFESRRWVFLVPMVGDKISEYVSRADEMLSESNANRPGHPLPKIAIHVAGHDSVINPQAIMDRLTSLLAITEVEHV